MPDMDLKDVQNWASRKGGGDQEPDGDEADAEPKAAPIDPKSATADTAELLYSQSDLCETDLLPVLDGDNVGSVEELIQRLRVIATEFQTLSDSFEGSKDDGSSVGDDGATEEIPGDTS
jgi:hypothetical protein